MVRTEALLAALETVIDPELGLDIVNLGLIYDVEFDPPSGVVTVEMTLTAPGCPLGVSITAAVDQALRQIEGVSGAVVSLVWQPPWDPSMMTPLGRARLGLS